MRIVIMAGGGGSRLWPASRNAHPKQFQKLTSDRTLLQETVRRIEPLAGLERVYVTTSPMYKDAVQENLYDLDPSHIFIEPMRRDNAAAIGLTIARLLHETKGEDDTFLMLPADHAIGGEEALRELLTAADAHATTHPDTIVMIGVRPTRPETGLGYIKMDATTREEVNGHEIYRVERFVEKPPREKAEEYIRDWTYLWNSGMYTFRLKAMWDLYRTFLPEMFAGLEAIASSLGTPDESKMIDAIYPTLPATSIDYGITEKATKVAVLPTAALEWSDIGLWQTLLDILPKDADGNVTSAHTRHLGIGTKDSLVFGTSKRLIGTIGLEGMIIVDTEDALLVARADQASEIKKLLEALKEIGQEGLL